MHDTAFKLPALGHYHAELGGIFFGIALGDDGKTYGLVIARPEDYSPISGEYGAYGNEIKGAESYREGLVNTNAMAATGSDIAQQVRALRIADFDDWFIPTNNEARMALSNAPEALPERWIWTSTQFSAHYAWCQASDGYQYWFYKYDEGAVVPVRRFQIPEQPAMEKS